MIARLPALAASSVLSLAVVLDPALAQSPQRPASPPAAAAARTAAPAKSIGPPPGDLNPKPGEHPLTPLIRWGKLGIAALQKLDDYSCTLVKRERIAGKLGNHEWMTVKLRHQPFSVYAAFRGRQERPKQEVVYIAGQNSGKMFVHCDEYRLMGTVSLFPDSRRALREGRYPVTETGILNLIQRLVEHAENDVKYDDCEVKIFKNAKIESRPCLYIRVTHKERRPEFSFHLARIFIDNELNVPVRYEAFTWPEDAGGKPVPIEEYTYLNFRFNERFTDRDFDINNPDYYFPPDYDEPKVELAASAAGPMPAAGARTANKPAATSPLSSAIALARDAQARVEAARDYACLLSQREQEGGEPGKFEHMLLKVRHQPASIYAFFLGPRSPKGEEAIFIAGANGGMALVHPAASHGQSATSRGVPPGSPELTQWTGEPIDELGMKQTIARWVKMYESDLPHGEAETRYYKSVKVDHRPATCIEVTHPTKRPHFRFSLSRLYIDEETKLPVRFEAYGWSDGAKPAPLAEELTYRNVELDRGFTDQDFDPANPNYAFGAETAARRVRTK